MSVSKDITIEDQHGGTMALTYDAGRIDVIAIPGEGRDTVEIDETDRRDLAEWLNGAR